MADKKIDLGVLNLIINGLPSKLVKAAYDCYKGYWGF